MPLTSGNITPGNFKDATAEEVNNIANNAADAFEKLRHTSANERAIFLETIANNIDAIRTQLVEVTMQETFLPQGRLDGEINRTINQLKLFASVIKEGSWVRAIIDTAQPDRKPLPKPDIRQMQIPLGPVCVFGAGNFPFAFSVAGGDTASALAAGCPVIYKVHPGHPATSQLVAQQVLAAADACNMPAASFSYIHAKDNAISIALVKHAAIKAVAFTGSLRGGRALFDAVAQRPEPVPVYAEMGSINPVFVLPGIMKESAGQLAEKLAASNLLNAGQFCTNPGLVVSVASDETENFAKTFSKCVQQSTPEAMLNENIYTGYTNAVKNLMVHEELRLKSYGKELPGTKTAVAHMFQANAESFLTDETLWHEIFGPASIHVVAGNMNVMLAIANVLQGQLTTSIWANDEDMEQTAALLQILEKKCGRVILNNVPTGVEVTHAMVHGGPYPATTDSRSTSVGTTAIYRFTRPVCYQNFPDKLLPAELKNKNNTGISRMVNGTTTNADIG